MRSLLFFLCVLLWGCADMASRSPYARAKVGSVTMDTDDDDDSYGGEAEEAPPTPGDVMNAGPMKGEPPAVMAPQAQKPPPVPGQAAARAALLIYTASYGLVVVEVDKTLDAVQELAKGLGGYLVQRHDASITVRVPSAKYRDALADIAKLGEVTSHEESVEDVTEQYNDLVTRLANARAVRARLQELLAAAKGVTETLAVERELARVTEEIELMEGKLKRMTELILFSTITVNCTAKVNEQVASQVTLPFPWLGQLGLGPLLQLR